MHGNEMGVVGVKKELRANTLLRHRHFCSGYQAGILFRKARAKARMVLCNHGAVTVVMVACDDDAGQSRLCTNIWI
jgi:hypothetical protein